MNLKRNLIKETIVDVLNELSVKKRKSLTRFSLLLTCIGFLINIIITSISVFFNFNLSTGTLFDVIVRPILKIIFWVNGITNGMILFLYVLKLMKLWEESYFERLVRYLLLKPVKSLYLIKEMIRHRKRMTRIKKNIVNCFGLLIINWFLYIFLRISGYITISQGNYITQSDISLFMYWFMFIISIGSISFFLIFMMILIDDTNYYVRDQSRVIIDLFSSHNDHSNIILTKMMLKEFEDECNFFSISPCGLFVLNKRLILGFVTSMITFTVLFVQISDSISQKR